MTKQTVFIPMEKWQRGRAGAWGNGKSGGCANTFIQKSQGVMAHFGPHFSKLDRVVTNEIVRINDNPTTPDDYKQKALAALLEPYGIELVFVAPPCAAQSLVPAAISGEEEEPAAV